MSNICRLEKEIQIDNGGCSPVYADIRTADPDSALPVIILCHGFLGYKRWGWLPFLPRRISLRAFHPFTIRFSMNRTHEKTGRITKPEEFARNTFTREVHDLENTLSYVRNGKLPVPADHERLGLFGHSRGGAVCIITAGRFKEVKSLVTWSSPPSLDRYTNRRKKKWAESGRLTFQNSRADRPLNMNYSFYEDIDSNREKYDLLSQVSNLRIPHLIIHGEQDAAVSLKEAEKFIKLNRAGRCRFDRIKRCGHTFGTKHPMTKPTKELLSSLDRTEEWLVETVPE